MLALRKLAFHDGAILELVFEDAQLQIDRGTVSKLCLGEVHGTGSVATEGQPFMEQPLNTTRTPGVLRFDPPIAL